MPAERQRLRHALHRVAYGQSGYFSARQARDVGYSYQAQKYHVDHGNWVRVDRGLFRLPDWPAGSDDSYVRWSVWSGGRAVISHESALSVHDLGLVSPARVHMTVPRGFRARNEAVVLHVADLSERDVQERPGYLVTTPIRTLLDVAASDLSQEHIDEAVNDAMERNLVTARRLRSRSDEAGNRAALRIERALVKATVG